MPFIIRKTAYAVLVFLFVCCGCVANAPDGQHNAVERSNSHAREVVATTMTDSGNRVTLSMEGSSPLVYTSVKRPFPPGVLLYFPDTVIDDRVIENFPENAYINSVTKINSDDAPDNSSGIEILLMEDMVYQVVPENNTLKVVFTKPRFSISEPTEDGGDVSGPGEDVLKKTEGAGNVNNAQVKSTTSRAVWINRIDFFAGDNGASTLEIGATGQINYKLDKDSHGKIIILVENAKLADHRKLPIITEYFNSAVNRVTPVQAGTNVKFTVELRENVPYLAEKKDNLLSVKFFASTVPPRMLEQPPSEIDKQSLNTNLPVEKPVLVDDEPVKKERFSGQEKKRYTGEKIALDFYETDIKNVFRIINDISSKNFAVDSDVTGKVTMALKTPVPWDQVLELVLTMNGLGTVENGDIVRIATLKTLAMEENQRRASMEAIQKTREQAIALKPMITEYISVNYANAGTDVAPHISALLTPGRGTMSINERNNMLIITDVPEKISQARDIVKKVDKVIPQVIIEARVVEVTDTFSRELGIEWDASVGPKDSGLLGGITGLDAAFNYPVASDGSSIGFNFARIAGTPLTLNARITAAEVNGDAKLVSSPKIITMDNKKASIKQGTEVAYLERDDSGGSSVKFKNADLLLEVTPHITPDRRIIMELFITKNDMGAAQTNEEPPLLTNEARTELLIDDGDTIVIGGVVKTSTTGGETGFPGLSKIPLLGYLFKKTNKSKEKHELLIFITTRIVILGDDDGY